MSQGLADDHNRLDAAPRAIADRTRRRGLLDDADEEVVALRDRAGGVEPLLALVVSPDAEGVLHFVAAATSAASLYSASCRPR